MSSADAVEFVLNLLERETEVDAVSHDTSGAACDEVTHAGPEPPGLLSSQRDAPFSKEDHPANDEIDEAENADRSLRVGLGVVCEMLLDECIARGSTDNVSVVLVLLDHTLRAKRWLLCRQKLHTVLQWLRLPWEPLIPNAHRLPYLREQQSCVRRMLRR